MLKNTLMAGAISLALVACAPPAEDTGSLASYVASTYGNNYNAFARAEWERVANYAYYGDLEAVKLMAANGMSFRKPAGATVSSFGPSGDNLLSIAAWSREAEVTRYILEQGILGIDDVSLLDAGVTFGNVPITRIALDYDDIAYVQCEDAGCFESYSGLQGAIEYGSKRGRRQGDYREVNALITAYMNDPANAAEIRETYQRDLARVASVQEQARSQQRVAQANAAQSGSSGGGGLGLFGALAGSVIGGAIGGAEGDVFNSTFSGIMEGAESGNVVTGTMSAIGQGSGLMDANSAALLGAAGGLFGGTQATTQSGAIQRPQATQQQVSVPQQSAALGQATSYNFSCPMGSGPHTVQIPASSLPNCPTAMRTLAVASTCNLIDEMEAAQNAYFSQCAAEIYN